MTDQRFEQELEELMETDLSGNKKHKKIRKSISRKKKIFIGVAVLAVALFVTFQAFGKKKEVGMPVMTATLAKGDIQEVLSISGPVSGTDSAEVVSNLHAEILELLVKEGDQVAAGDILGRLEKGDVQKEVDIAKNSYDLAVANQEEARRQAEYGYAKALQDAKACQVDYDRKSVLAQGGDIAPAELEVAKDAFEDAKRQVSTFTLENGSPVANKSYGLQVENAAFELERKEKRLAETEMKSPIAGTVVRVNSRVGRFADVVDGDKPLFVIDNLERLEMKIKISEYSIGKIEMGQTVVISADILDGVEEMGAITAISPTGEEKGGGSAERVIPITVQIQNTDTKLIAGITAKAEIVLNEATDTWVVPISAAIQTPEGVCLVAVENQVAKLIPVETGVESDVQVEVKSDALADGLTYIITPDATMKDGTPVTVMPTEG